MRGLLLVLLLSCQITTGETGSNETPTVIQSDRLEVIGSEDGNEFVFSGSVVITGDDFNATCERMVVRTQSRNKGAESGFGAIRVVEATGSVRIVQGAREATAGRALIYPGENRVVLEDGPVVRDANGTVRGYRMTLHGENRKISVEPGPSGERPSVELPTLRTLEQ